MGLFGGRLDNDETRDTIHDFRRAAREIAAAAVNAAETYREHVRLLHKRADVNEALLPGEASVQAYKAAEAKAAQDNKSKAARASVEPVVRIIGNLLVIESGDDTVETRICIPGGGLSYDALLKALPTFIL